MTPTSLSNTICITGASSGFGAAIAKKFASEGWKTLLLARRLDRLKELSEELSKSAPSIPVELDVADRAAVTDKLASLWDQHGPIDVLVNNAGLALGLGSAHEASLDDWEQMIDINIKGLTYCTRALLPHFVKRGRGTVIMMGSVAATWPYPGGNAYGATKAFVQQFSRNLRSDLLGTGVRVACIEPGLAETEFSLIRFKGDPTRAKQPYAGTSALSAEDIAEATWWIASRPEHVNINSIEIMPTTQAWAPFAIHRTQS